MGCSDLKEFGGMALGAAGAATGNPWLAAGGAILGGMGDSPSYGGPYGYQFPAGFTDTAVAGLPAYYQPRSYAPGGASFYSSLYPTMRESLEYRTPLALRTPTLRAPTAGQSVYEDFMSGASRARIPALTGPGASARDVLNQRLLSGGGMPEDLLARQREQLAAQIAKARETGYQGVMEDLQSRGLFAPGSEGYRMMGDVEKGLAETQDAALLQQALEQAKMQEESRQFDISQGLGYGLSEQQMEQLIEQQNLSRQLDAAGVLRGEEAQRLAWEDQTEYAEQQYQRLASDAERQRVYGQAMNMYEYFTNLDDKSQTQAINTMVQALQLAIGASGGSAQVALQAWVDSERFAQADDASFMSMMTEIGRTLKKPAGGSAQVYTNRWPSSQPVQSSTGNTYGYVVPPSERNW